MARNLKRNSPYVFGQLNGGLGNQLFQIACAHTVAKRRGKQLLLSSMPTCNERPAYYTSWYYKFSRNKYGDPNPDETLSKQLSRYIGEVIEYSPIPDHANYLCGYYQSPKYFDVDEMRQLFQIPSQMHQMFNKYYESLLQSTSPSNTLVVHVRRSDYLTFDGGKLFHLTIDYYAKAIDRAKQLILKGQQNTDDMKLLVISDDIGWCSEQDIFKGAQFLDDQFDVRSMWIMSRYAHFVMSNSTFCWWSVVLGEPYKTVIAPFPWHPPKWKRKCQDIYMDDWIRLPFGKE